MSEENKVSRGLGAFESSNDVKLGKKGTPGKEILYTGLDGNNKGKAGLKAVYLIGTIDDASRKVLASLKSGDKFVVVKTKKPGDEYYNVSGFESAEGYTPKAAWTGNKFTEGGASTRMSGADRYSKKEFDTTGIKVGAARNQAIALLTGIDFFPKATTIKDPMKTVLDVVDQWAYEIVKRQQVQEDVVRSGTSTPQQEVELANAQMQQDLDDDVDLDF